MSSISIYFLQSAIGMAFFYALYWMFLKNDTFFRVNRMFLLLTLIAALLIPILEIPFKIAPAQEVETPSSLLDAVVVTSQQYLGPGQLEEVVVTATAPAQTSFPYFAFFTAFYLVGVLLFLLRFIKNLARLSFWVRNGERVEREGYVLIIVDENYPPFSFLNYVFVNKGDFQRKNLKPVLAHELVHIRQHHTFDLLVVEIVCMVFWFNPLVWLYKYSLQEVHEYLADDSVVNSEVSTLDYKKQIVNQVFDGELFKFANNFGQSAIKKRLIMMSRMKTPRFAMVKLILVFPIIVFLLSAFAFTVYEETKIVKQLHLASQEIVTDGEYSHFWDNVAFSGILGFNGDSETLTNKGISRLQHKSMKVGERPKEYAVVDEMPMFPGGSKNLQKYLNKKLDYPAKAWESNIKGRVFVGFVVSSKGKVENVKVIKGVHPLLDREACRVVESMPLWKPGTHKGKHVRVFYTVPIQFMIPDFKTEPLEFANLNLIIQPVRGKETGKQKLILPFRKDEVYIAAEKMPRFPGGKVALKSYLHKKVRYPQLAIDHGNEGKVYVSFVVDKEGNVDKVRIKKGVSKALNHEALRVIESMPAWEPAEQLGRKVAVTYTVPIRFALQ
ncbi:MAG: TonB family protein [Marinifilaceae bacterium]